MTEDEPPRPTETEAEERRQLRPYRRLVGALFALAIAVIAVLVLRGIIRHLDRLPSVDALAKPKVVDVRALRACAEDLEKLEVRVRLLAGQALAAPSETRPRTWDEVGKPLEVERLGIVARCRLNETTNDAVVRDLELAASELEELLRAYALLYARHSEGAIPHSEEVRRALRRATAALSTR